MDGDRINGEVGLSVSENKFYVFKANGEGIGSYWYNKL
jgi:hypothetical protein